MNAAIYARFSSHAQREESIDQQVRVCRQWAKENGYQIVSTFTDCAISGTTDKRPGFQQMMLEAEKRQWDTLLVYSHDRFARNRYDAATYRAKLKKCGVKVIAVTLPLDDKPESVLIEAMMEGYAEYYSINLSRSVRRGMDENALKGKSNGALPIGFKSEGGSIVLDPAGAKAVQMIFDMYEAGVPKTEIIKKLHDSGFKSRSGKRFGYSSLSKILRNERYTGVYIYKDVRIEDAMPMIITRDQFDRVQAIMDRCGRKGHNSAQEEYVLSGKIFCGECGAPLIGESGRSKCGGVYRYYKCSKKKHKGAGSCPKRTEKKEVIESAVISYVMQILTDENIKLIAQKCFLLLEEEYRDKSLLEAYQAEYKEVSVKIDNIMTAIENGIFTAKTKERLEALEERQQELENLIVAEQLKKPAFTAEHFEFYLMQFRGGHVDDPDFVRALIGQLVNAIYVFDEKEGDGQRIAIALNLKNTPTARLRCSDVHTMVDHWNQSPKILYRKYLVIFIF